MVSWQFAYKNQKTCSRKLYSKNSIFSRIHERAKYLPAKNDWNCNLKLINKYVTRKNNFPVCILTVSEI